MLLITTFWISLTVTLLNIYNLLLKFGQNDRSILLRTLRDARRAEDGRNRSGNRFVGFPTSRGRVRWIFFSVLLEIHLSAAQFGNIIKVYHLSLSVHSVHSALGCRRAIARRPAATCRHVCAVRLYFCFFIFKKKSETSAGRII